MPRTFKATLAYDGTDYSGWQVQPSQPTVQGTLQDVLAGLEGGPVAVDGSGRTDAGVHAEGQVASFRLDNPLPPENLQRALNHRLPPAIRVLALAEAPAAFHARSSATAKTYEYRIWRENICSPFLARFVCHHPYPLDEAAMQSAATYFRGEQDFASLMASGGPDLESTVRTIFSSTLARDGAVLRYQVRGNGFLYRMVRNIVGLLFEVGRGNLAPKDITAVLAAKQRSAAGATALASGLFLMSVEYGDK